MDNFCKYNIAMTDVLDIIFKHKTDGDLNRLSVCIFID